MFFLNFYFLNTDFWITIWNWYLKLKEVPHNVIPEGSMSQIFNLGPGCIFMI